MDAGLYQSGEGNEKLEDLLNLNLQATTNERERSENLDVGYSTEEKNWELIVKYNGNLRNAAGQIAENIRVEELIAGYAIVTLPESSIEEFASLEEVEYVEMPKRLYFEQVDGRWDICWEEVSARTPKLTGEGVLIAVIDSGIDYFHPEFIRENGRTKIAALWDQTVMPDEMAGRIPPTGFEKGVLFTNEMINASLNASAPGQGSSMVSSVDNSGHGTAVASIAVGQEIGVAPGSELVVVKLGNPLFGSFPKTTELMRALTFVARYAQERRMPVVINLSFGSVYGNHLGSSLLERFINNISEVGRNVICVGSGNEAASLGHFVGTVGDEELAAELSVGNYEPSLNLQIWKNYYDSIQLTIVSPGGEVKTIPSDALGVERFVLGGVEFLGYFGSPLPYSALQEIYMEMYPKGNYLPSGIWTFRIRGTKVREGTVRMYLPSYSVRSADTGFFLATPEGTLTIPSTAERVITVGAYHSGFDAYADFSGRGIGGRNPEKPDLVAPGVNVVAASSGGGYQGVSGTSFATPFVTGGAALLMEWGIVRGNDPFLYGEKVKAYLIRGAKPLRGEVQYPNTKVGWGALCIADSIPE